MTGIGFLTTLVVRLPTMVAYTVGLVVALALLARRRDAPAWLAFIGFGLLLVANISSWLLNMVPLWSASFGHHSMVGIAGALSLGNVVLNVLAAGGAICLAVALWMGLGQNRA
jgi:hypothetical protein